MSRSSFRAGGGLAGAFYRRHNRCRRRLRFGGAGATVTSRILPQASRSKLNCISCFRARGRVKYNGEKRREATAPISLQPARVDLFLFAASVSSLSIPSVDRILFASRAPMMVAPEGEPP